MFIFTEASTTSNSSITLSPPRDISTPESLHKTHATKKKAQSSSKVTETIAAIGEEDSADSSSESDLDAGQFNIKYEITVGKARIDFTLDNITPFTVFQQNVATQMGLPLQHLSALGYVLSFWPKSPKPVPKLVDTDLRYEDMIHAVEEYEKVGLTKKGKEKKKKPFYIHLVDTSSDEGTNKDGKKV